MVDKSHCFTAILKFHWVHVASSLVGTQSYSSENNSSFFPLGSWFHPLNFLFISIRNGPCSTLNRLLTFLVLTEDWEVKVFFYTASVPLSPS